MKAKNIKVGPLEGILTLPEGAKGIVLFVHGSGSSRHSPRNQLVAHVLNKAGFATLLIDLLSKEEDTVYKNRFNIALLTDRVTAIIDWIKEDETLKKLPLGLFGASTGAAAALQVAAKLKVDGVVSRGGRPDLAGDALFNVYTPTLLIVGGADFQVLALNQEAYEKIPAAKKLKIVPYATHLFEEEGCLEKVAELSVDWFSKTLAG